MFPVGVEIKWTTDYRASNSKCPNIFMYYFQNIFRTWSHLRHGDNIFNTNLDLHANQLGLFKLKALSYIYISYYNNIVYLFLFPGDFHLNWISFTLYKFKCIHLILTFVARRELSGYDKLPLTYICNVFIFISPFKHEELFLVAYKFCNDDKYSFSPPQVCETTVFSLQCYKVLFIIFLLHSTSFQNIGETTLVINQLPYFARAELSNFDQIKQHKFKVIIFWYTHQLNTLPMVSGN